MNNLAIEAHGLVKTFGSNRAVDGVNLNIPTGSICSVLGLICTTISFQIR
jgi:ABC-2 type transport system ATP-binding protein